MGALLETLKARAPLSVAEYMRLCNKHYYATRDPFGVQGDFTTAPEISQIFGEVIGAFITHMAEGEPYTLIEGGPGRGTLMADLLRVTKPEEAILIETSPVLRKMQREKLVGKPVRWSETISNLNLINQNNMLIFNELFDALPIEQHVCRQGYWHEGLVRWEEERFVFGWGERSGPECGEEGMIYETSYARESFMADITVLLQKGGMALVVDYGPYVWGPGDTLQAVVRHQKADALANPGEADLTSHVDFGALSSVAQKAGLYVHPLMTQGEFLTRLGGGIRAQKLGKDPDYERLVAADQMGELFKVLIVCHPDWRLRLQEVFA